MLAVLANDPFRLTPKEVAQMTPRQVARLYFCDRDDRGQVRVAAAGETGYDPRAAFNEHLYAVGITDPERQEELYRASGKS